MPRGGKKRGGGGGGGLRLRPAPKGREVEPAAHADVIALLGQEPRRRDLLIEHLHKLQDHFGHLSAAHLTALAWEMRLTPAEVYEVASFYHHFDIVKDGPAPPALTVRICESIACQMAGAELLLADVTRLAGVDVRVVPAPCVGRCEHAPVAVVGRKPIHNATTDAVQQSVESRDYQADIPSYIGYEAYRAGGGYSLLIDCVEGRRSLDDVIANAE